MSRVLTFSRVFPSYHPRAGEPTYFVEKIWESQIRLLEISLSRCCELSRETGIGNYTMNSIRKIDFEPKYHTMRAGHRWKVGDWFSPRVWSADPYRSKQIQFSPDIQIKQVWDFEFTFDDLVYIGNELYAYSSSHEALEKLASNDGLTQADLLAWFNKPIEGQIICWNENINY